MTKSKKNKVFSVKDKLVLYLNGEEREFKNFNEFNKETKISGAVLKDLIEGKLQHSFKGWDIVKDRK